MARLSAIPHSIRSLRARLEGPAPPCMMHSRGCPAARSMSQHWGERLTLGHSCIASRPNASRRASQQPCTATSRPDPRAAAAAAASPAASMPAALREFMNGHSGPRNADSHHSEAEWTALHTHLSLAATPRVEAADALAHNKWEPTSTTLTQQQLWERIRQDARDVAASGACRPSQA